MSPVTFRQAKRHHTNVLVGLAGASGSGKTYTALRLASGLAAGKKIAFIDTENGRALHYADAFEFDHAVLDPPFRPERYLEAIKSAEEGGYPVIVVDSASHEYSGQGGLMDWQQEELDRLAGDNVRRRNALSASAWREPKNAHARFRDDLLRVKAHLILCFRARQAIEMVQEDGKTVVRPTQALDSFQGWLIETEHKRANLTFEMTCSFLFLPDRPGIPQPMKLSDELRQFFPLDRPVTEASGRDLGTWAMGAGTEEDKRAPKLVTELLAAAEELGKRDQTQRAVAATRSRYASEPEKYVGWLESQLSRAQTALEAVRATAGEDLFGDDADPTSPTEEA